MEAIIWSDEVREKKEQELCETVGLLQERASKVFGEPSVRRLRLAFLKGGHVFNDDDLGRKSMESLLHMENEFLRAYTRLVTSLSASFYRTNHGSHPDLEIDDYKQEACLVLINSVYHYDGSTKFITYLQNSIQRGLSCFIRDHEERAGVGRKIKKVRRVVVKLMNQNHWTLTEAIDSIEAETPLSNLEKRKLADSIYKTIPVENHKLNARAGGNVSEEIDSEMVWLCIEQAELTPLERGLIEAHMQDDAEYRSELTKKINPNTGRNYSRQSLSQTFIKACGKIREVMQERKFAA